MAFCPEPRAVPCSRAMARSTSSQASLFELPRPHVGAVTPKPEHVALREAIPASIRLGAMTWSYAGWKGVVYAASASEKQLARHGLTAYARHPLLRMAEIDRTYYEPISAAAFRAYAEQVPDDFRFLVKAHQDCTTLRFPEHARYGARRGQANARYLDAAYAERAVIAPAVEGLGTKLGTLLFQFPPQDAGGPRAFARALRAFLRKLPRGPSYAVELRNVELLTTEYAAALEEAGAIHCHNAWTAMPPVIAQARRIPPGARRPLLVRWLMRANDRFEDARARFAPFDRLADEDADTRTAIASLVARAQRHGVPAFVLVDNKAEGCAPESVFLLAQAIAAKLAAGA